MGLYERLAKAQGDTNGETPTPTLVEATAPDQLLPEDPLSELRRKVHSVLVQSLGPRLYELSASPERLEEEVRSKLNEVIASESTPLSAAERQRLLQETMQDVLGYGPIEPLLNDDDVTEVMVNGAEFVFVERNGKLQREAIRFLDDSHLRRTIDKIVGQVGRRIDESSPYVDARLPDGSRVNAVIPPVAIDGPMLTIRKFSRDPYQAEDLVSFGTMSTKVAQFLAGSVEGKINMLVSGGTGAGKTTTLNVLSSWIPDNERIVTIEDAAELQLNKPHVVRMEYRPPNIEGKGEVAIRDLVRNALRMRPDRIVVGEVRGGEALDMLQAMNTGHEGSISTIHSNSPRDALSRLETMVLMAGVDLPVRAIREQIAAGIDLIVHQSRLKDGSRRLTHVTEVVGMEGDVITLQDIFLFDYSMGMDEKTGRFLGHIKPTGLRPQYVEHLRELGINLEAEIFDPEGFTASGSRKGGR